MLVAQISNGKLALGGLFDGLKVNVKEYSDIIDKFSKLTFDKKLMDVENGEIYWDKVAKAIGTTDERAISYFKTLDDGEGKIDNSSASLDGMSTYLKSTGQAFDFAAIKANLLNAGINALIMLEVSMAIKGFIKFISVQNEVAESAKELSNSFNDTTNSINDYKEKVDALYATINSSASSLSAIADARKELLSIQSEMINKYSSETGAISAITEAVNTQTRACEKMLT